VTSRSHRSRRTEKKRLKRLRQTRGKRQRKCLNAAVAEICTNSSYNHGNAAAAGTYHRLSAASNGDVTGLAVAMCSDLTWHRERERLRFT